MGFDRKLITMLLLALLFFNANPVISETSKERDIRKLLQVSGILEQLTYMQDTLLNNISIMVTGSFSKVPDEFWGEFNKLIGKSKIENSDISFLSQNLGLKNFISSY